MDAVALRGVLLDQVEEPQLPTSLDELSNPVPAPEMVAMCRPLAKGPAEYRTALRRLPRWELESFLVANSLHPLLVHRISDRVHQPCAFL